MLLRRTPAGIAVLEAVLLAVVVCELGSRLDRLDRHHVHAAAMNLRLAIRFAGMVDIPCLVVARLAVDGLVLADLEEVLAAACIRLFLGEDAPYVLDHARALLYAFARKKTEPESGARALNLKGEIARNIAISL